MKKRIKSGFTLVELMAVIIIIALISLLTFPSIINQIKKTKKANNDNINTIVIEAAKKYVNDNKEEFNGYDYCIPISDLVDNDYIKEDVVNINDYGSNKVVYYVVNNNSKSKVVNSDDCKTHLSDKDGNIYDQVEYLESSGEQYIDTKTFLKISTKIELKFYFSKATNYFGAAYGYKKNNSNVLGIYWTGGITYTGFGNKNDVSYYDDEIGSIPKVYVHNKDGLLVNNVKRVTYQDTVVESDPTYSIYIFARMMPNDYRKSYIKLYYYKIYDGDELVRDYIPAMNSENRPCLFDKVERKCYYNQGTGEFLYG